MYRWRGKKSGKYVEILRSFSTYEEPPTEEEATEAGVSEEEMETEEWVREIGEGITTVRGKGFRGSKGNW